VERQVERKENKMAKTKEGTVCKLLKSKNIVKCYDKKGMLVGAYVPKKTRRMKRK